MKLFKICLLGFFSALFGLIQNGCGEAVNSELLVGNLSGSVFLSSADSVYEDYSGVRVWLQGTTIETISDTRGRWKFSNVPTRTYNIAYSKEGFGTYVDYGFQFVGGGDVLARNIPLYRVPDCPMVLDDMRQEENSIFAFAHSECPDSLARDRAVFYFSNSPNVSSENYSYALANESSFPSMTVVVGLDLRDVNKYAEPELDLEDSVYVIAYSYGGGSYSSLDGRSQVYTSLNPTPSRRLAILPKR
jgi:hypothetical protein